MECADRLASRSKLPGSVIDFHPAGSVAGEAGSAGGSDLRLAVSDLQTGDVCRQW
jgi:hypothetical protein